MPVSGGDQVDRDGCRTRPAHQAKIGRGLTEHHAEASSCAGRFAVQGCPVAVKGIPSNARRESKIFTLLPALSLSGKGPYCTAYAWSQRDGDHTRGLRRHTECAFS